MNEPFKTDAPEMTQGGQNSVSSTRRKLEEALTRIVKKAPLVVKADKKITVATVAREAGVDRATVYRFHQIILDKIRLHTTPNQSKCSLPVSKDKEYRALIEEAQRQVEALARANYQLQSKVEELQEALSVREKNLAELQYQLIEKFQTTRNLREPNNTTS